MTEIFIRIAIVVGAIGISLTLVLGSIILYLNWKGGKLMDEEEKEIKELIDGNNK